MMTFDDEGRSPEFPAFAKAQDQAATVNLGSVTSCALCQFLNAEGYPDAYVWPGEYFLGNGRAMKTLPHKFDERLYGDSDLGEFASSTWAEIVARMEA